jgi:hypothetical protein
MGMSFRTFHLNGVFRVPQYVQWLQGCVMREKYVFHRDVRKFVEIDPNAKFLWNHRDPAKALGAVCRLIAAERLTWRAEAIERAMDFRRPLGGDRFVDASFADPHVARSYAQLGFTLSNAARATVHNYDLGGYGLTPGHARKALGNCLGAYDASA